MARGFTRFLKRSRDNYYLSWLLASLAKPLHSVCARAAVQMERKVRKNGVSIALPNGKSMRIARDAGIGIASALFWHGLDGYEPESSSTLRYLFERSATFIDVGANYGIYSVLGGLWNPKLRVIAFEPVAPIYEGLKKNVRLNRLEDRITCENLALARESGKATFFMPETEGKDPESTGTLVSDGWQARQGSPHLQIETVAFDDYERHHPMQVDLVKIDVEDFEADVLAGMQGMIRRDRPFIVCEVLPRNHRNQRTRDMVEFLKYQPYWITPSGYIRVPQFDFGRQDFHNFLLSPVSTPDMVIDNLGVLLELKRQA